MSEVLIEDIFDVRDIDPDGKKFDLVSRLFCDSESFKMDLILDVNTQVYPVKVGNKFRMVLCTALNDNENSDKNNVFLPEHSRASQFEYVMHGKIYRIESADNSHNEKTRKISIYVSFGGLLMRITGESSHLRGFQLDTQIYLMMKKLAF